MSDISKVDKNFKVDTKISAEDIEFINADSEVFEIFGIFKADGMYRRLPESVAKNVSPGVHGLHAHTAGGRVRFLTDSPYVAISVKMPTVGKMPHFALTGSAGFDLYVKDRYFKTFVPPFKIEEDYESVIDFTTSEKREITINFPLYSDVSELYIGLKEGSFLGEPKPYKYEKPIVFYGSSITQGGCASRPGMAYESIVSRRLDADYLNLGFSGSAKAEEEIAEYIKNLEMSVFVYDYDHNAPTTEHLKETHEKMFKTIRESNPHLPVVMMSRPKYSLTEEEEERFSIIEKTYLNAMGNGDENVYLIDGKTLMWDARDEGTVDSCHPNDLGFASMAKAVGDVLEKIL